MLNLLIGIFTQVLAIVFVVSPPRVLLGGPTSGTDEFVAPVSSEPRIDFRSQVLPTLTKQGCNSGACHGAAAGRGGFHLSLLGASPDMDYEAIVYEFEGRRVDRVAPAQSLLLLKGSGQLEHGGGTVLSDPSASFDIVLQWLRQVASDPKEGRNTPFSPLATLHIEGEFTCTEIPSEREFKVYAVDEGGLRRDVSAYVSVQPKDPQSVEYIETSSSLRVKQRGEHSVLVRYQNQVKSIVVCSPFPLREDHRIASVLPKDTWIDQSIVGKLRTMGLDRFADCGDEVFLRRVSLDLTGRLPRPAWVERFYQSPESTRRADYVDFLLDSPEYVTYWTHLWSRWLQVRGLPMEPEVVETYGNWIRDQIRDDIPLDRFARELILATGDSHRVGPANFARMVAGPREQAELVGKLFLGVRIGCANCHDHPLDRWTQDDFHGFSSLFASLSRGRTVKVSSGGSVTNPRTGEPAIFRLPGLRNLRSDESSLEAVAQWMTQEEPAFRRSLANRYWAHFMGRGLVHPIDDMSQTNVPTHPELLEALGNRWGTLDFRAKEFIREIVLCSAYARSGPRSEDSHSWPTFYTHYEPRPLAPEAVVDAIHWITDTPSDSGKPPALEWIDGNQQSETLQILGRCIRSGDCTTSEAGANTLPAQLHRLNSDWINGRIAHPDGRLRRMLRDGASVEIVLQSFYRLAYSRSPTQAEMQYWLDRIQADSADRKSKSGNTESIAPTLGPTSTLATSEFECLEDFVWSLLNSPTFLTNH